MGDFTMPSLGADMEAGTLVEWRIKPGDAVKRGEIVAVVDTQKGAIDIEIFEDGRVDSLLVEIGAKVPVGTVLARIAGAGAPAPAVTPPPPSAPLPPGSAGPELPQRLPGRESAEHRTRASPAARAAAGQLGVNLDDVPGTGPGGAVSREDVERFTRQRPARPVRAGLEQRPGMRKAISAAMSRSNREIPHYYLSTRVNLSPALTWLRRRNQPLPPGDRALPIVPLLKAIALATRKVPEVNGFYENDAFRPGPGIHLGVAISLRAGGLVVPALHDVSSKPIDVLSRELMDLIERARRGQLRSSELADATLTVTNLGERGVEQVFGVIFPPQVALVGLGKIVEAPWVIEGQCVARSTIMVSLSADHRVSDGHRGGLFLADIDHLLQAAEAL